ncbi:MAG: D-alanyl-D-alanine carboxypeptidase [Oscillospiraceae bacterium]|nr:D-alanyl-D-alanine carboxypeptidase [Oscillospiraceae bacterium]
MKRWFGLEFLLLIMILLTAVMALVTLPGRTAEPALSDSVSTTQTTAQTTQTETTVPTEPEVEITWMEFPEDRELTALKAFVYDCQAGELTVMKGEETGKLYPASITKLFTAYIVLQYLQPETVVTAGAALDFVKEGSSVAEIQKGDKLTVEMLVQGMLLPSGNDAAYILAVETGRKLLEDDSASAQTALDAFLEEMNSQAESLGMTGTHFTNPDGYHHKNHYSTMADMAILGKLSVENETIMTYAKMAQAKVTFENGTKKKWKNTNALINPESEYYCPIVTGLKTGQTLSAGSCLMSSFERGSKQYVVGIFGCQRPEERFADTIQLINETVKK